VITSVFEQLVKKSSFLRLPVALASLSAPLANIGTNRRASGQRLKA